MEPLLVVAASSGAFWLAGLARLAWQRWTLSRQRPAPEPVTVAASRDTEPARPDIHTR
jgi:hypothetical protein